MMDSLKDDNKSLSQEITLLKVLSSVHLSIRNKSRLWKVRPTSPKSTLKRISEKRA